MSGGAVRPWLVATSDPLAALALRACADRVERCNQSPERPVTIGVFRPSIEAAGALAELLAAACPEVAQQNTEAKREGVALYLIGDVGVPVSELLKAAA